MEIHWLLMPILSVYNNMAKLFGVTSFQRPSWPLEYAKYASRYSAYKIIFDGISNVCPNYRYHHHLPHKSCTHFDELTARVSVLSSFKVVLGQNPKTRIFFSTLLVALHVALSLHRLAYLFEPWMQRYSFLVALLKNFNCKFI